MENYVEILGTIMQKKLCQKTPDYAEISKIKKAVRLAFSNV